MIGRNFGRGLKSFEFRKLWIDLNYRCEINSSATTQKASKQFHTNFTLRGMWFYQASFNNCKRITSEQDEKSNPNKAK